MDEHCDAIVVGAGVGGLTAAARLAREGLRVLVVEQDPHPGGTAYTFIRRGFQFPMGPLGFSSPGLVRRAWEELTGEVLELRRVDYLVRAFGLEAVISRPFPLLEEELARNFPEEAAGIREFFGTVSRVAAGASPAEASPARDYLGGLVSDERLRRILGSQGTREPYSSLTLLAAQWRLMCGEGIHYPAGGFRRFCGGLAAAVESGIRGRGCGSRIMLRTEVREITADGGRVTGVVLEDGTRISADAVVSNADFKNTFLSLLDPGEVPPEWREAVSGARQTSSNLQVSLGVDAGRVDFSAFGRAGRIIYRRDGGAGPEGEGPEGEGPEGGAAYRDVPVDWDAGEIDTRALACQELELCLWSADDEALAPPGGAVVVIRTAASHRHFARFRPPGGLGGGVAAGLAGGAHRYARIPDYADYKKRLATALVEEAGRVLPGLAGAVEVLDVATPLTYEDRGRRSEGAVAGWSWDFEADAVRGQAARELVLTPLAGLYMSGYQAFSSLAMGGVPTAMESGRLAAEAVLAGTPPAGEVTIPGASSSETGS